MNNTGPIRRIVAKDLGLLSPEDLLQRHSGGRRRSLEMLIEQNRTQKKEINMSIYLEGLREKVRWAIDHARIKISYDDIMMIVTIFVLFADDIRLLLFPPSSDFAFMVLNSIAFSLFMLEIVLTSWVKSDFSNGIFKIKGYMFSFFFWLDLLAVISMIPDIPWLSDTLGLELFSGSSVNTRAGRAGKIGSRTGRVVKMVRLVRLVKLYKFHFQKKREKKMMKELSQLIHKGNIDPDEIEDFVYRCSNNQKQSKVGAELSDAIIRRVIIAVLLMLCIVPLLTSSPFTENEKEATQFLQKVNIETGIGPNADCEYLIGSANNYKDFMLTSLELSDYKNTPSYLIGLEIKPTRCGADTIVDFENVEKIAELRETSIRTIIIPPEIVNGTKYSVIAKFNLEPFVEASSKSGIYLTVFVVVVLVTLSMQFTGDAQKLVLTPIESMMEMVNMVANDPLEDFDFSSLSSGGQAYETRVVQVAIEKITALLRVGFGVAGAEIISSNMAIEGGTGSAVIEPMIPGQRVYAIFGFCDIHGFDRITEVLEDEIMSFVNSVARIVHEEVTRWGGLCNKNLGNAFLMVWRIGDQLDLQEASGVGRSSAFAPSVFSSSLTSSSSPGVPGVRRKSLLSKGSGVNLRNISVDLRRIPGLDIVADKALIGFLRVIIEINRHKQILNYRSDERLTRDTGSYKLRMGFGMHVGWAIEGAVGSLQKVDATYLSPHVNMAARMEAASRQFGVPILMTERFHELMSEEARSHCRKIDVVTVKGSNVAMPIYTCDTLQNQIFPELSTPKFANLDLEQVLECQAWDYNPSFWQEDDDLLQLRKLATPDFLATFKSGIDSYLNGDWLKAKEKLEIANDMMRESDTGGDGPSRTILTYMKNRSWTCPDDWKGYRPLTSK